MRFISAVLFVAYSFAMGIGCSSDEKECSDPSAKIFVTTNPSEATVFADGTEEIGVSVVAQLENCNPMPVDAEIEFRITNSEPSDAGQFVKNEESVITEYYGNYGPETFIVSNVV